MEHGHISKITHRRRKAITAEYKKKKKKKLFYLLFKSSINTLQCFFSPANENKTYFTHKTKLRFRNFFTTVKIAKCWKNVLFKIYLHENLIRKIRGKKVLFQSRKNFMLCKNWINLLMISQKVLSFISVRFVKQNFSEALLLLLLLLLLSLLLFV